MSNLQYIVTLTPLPHKPGTPPVEIRVRQAIKLLVKCFDCRAAENKRLAGSLSD